MEKNNSKQSTIAYNQLGNMTTYMGIFISINHWTECFSAQSYICAKQPINKPINHHHQNSQIYTDLV